MSDLCNNCKKKHTCFIFEDIMTVRRRQTLEWLDLMDKYEKCINMDTGTELLECKFREAKQ